MHPFKLQHIWKIKYQQLPWGNKQAPLSHCPVPDLSFQGCWKQAAGGPEDMGPCEAWRGGGAQSICGGPLLSGGRSGLELCEAGVGSPTRKLPVPWVEGGGLPECPGTEAGRTEGQQRPWCCDKRPTGDSGLLCRVTNSPMLFLSSKQSRKVGRSSVFTDTKTEAERG